MFERGFTIGVGVTIAANVQPGDIVIPAHLRYQACDEQTCDAPATVDAQWTVRVVSSGTLIALRHHEVFDGIAFGHGAAPSQKAATGSVVTARVADDGGLAMLDNFAVLATSGGYLGKDEFPRFINSALCGGGHQRTCGLNVGQKLRVIA